MIISAADMHYCEDQISDLEAKDEKKNNNTRKNIYTSQHGCF